MATVQLSDGTLVQVSAEDVPWLCRFRWHPMRNDNERRRIDVYTTLNLRDSEGRAYQRPIAMGRMLLGLIDPKLEVDHISGDTLDNRRENLRVATRQQNCRNRGLRSDNTTGFIGVQRRETGKFRARVMINGKQTTVGEFSCPIEAAKARDQHALQQYGEFARLNFPLGESA